MAFLQANVNLYAVLVAAIVSYVLGFIWYSPGVFGKKWMKLSGVKPPKNKGMAGQMLAGFIGTLVTAYILASVVALSGASTMIAGLAVGFWVWLGFGATLTLGSVLWEGKPMSLYYLNNGHVLLTYLVMAAIIAVWA